MIYISGRITGNENWRFDFQKAENYLISKGYEDEIVNPLDLDKIAELNCKKLNKVPTYKDYMITDIDYLSNYCDRIYMLRGWWRSKGARLEHHIARVLGMKIIYQKRGDKC